MAKWRYVRVSWGGDLRAIWSFKFSVFFDSSIILMHVAHTINHCNALAA